MLSPGNPGQGTTARGPPQSDWAQTIGFDTYSLRKEQSSEYTDVTLTAMTMKGPMTMQLKKVMTHARRWARLLTIVCLVMVTLSAAAPAAGAAGNQRPRECNGTMEGGSVNGDLVVPAEATCKLLGTVVRGDVRVGARATFDAESARITGNLRLDEQAAGGLHDTRVGGNVDIRGYWAFLDMFDGSIGGRVRVEDAERINLLGTTVDGDVRFERSRLFVADMARIKGQIKLSGAEIAIIDESRVADNVAIQGVTFETRICGSQLGSQVTFEGNSSHVTVGNHLKYCMGNTIDGNLRILQNTGGATIESNTVRGNLTCRDNNPAPVSSNNRVRGQKQGQCSGQ